MATKVAERAEFETETDGVNNAVKRLCKTCGKGFYSISGVYDHERRHHKKAPYKCCGLLFYSRGNLKRHRCGAHGEKKDFKCVDCNRTFALMADLRKHMKTHTEKPQYKCSICGIEQRKKQDHIDHMATHTKEKRHECERCGRKYRHQTNLYRHKRQCKPVENHNDS